MLNCKTVFITGAGSGIGAATARYFSDHGWFVGLYDLNLESVRTLSSDLGGNTCFAQLDVTVPDSVAAAFTHFAELTGGRLDVMVNNAGLFQDKPFVEADLEFLHLMMRVNMEGVVNCAQAAYPLLKTTSDSHLVNLGSGSSIYGIPSNAVYSSSKSFVQGLTEALRVEWEKDDITVNVVMPLYVATPMTEGVKLTHSKGSKMLTAEDIAAAVYEAGTTKGMYWVMPFKARLLFTLLRKMPSIWLHGFAKIYLSGKR
ncbi:SDR family NAD(P)-dependent oxidoreductase [Pseudohalioglobus lutimaris]|uniref:KR domain-containing protein n=1 Tax=Pseudohalioglobus lutimaris TaxID=1737061 RepID=A0A2N5X2N6_9GAMM|nr:SDR family NAD(P)-dependent oxidoreductase [Pseudohalioglobus lutimaris]PLW68751.1 KR domain-containing protein [Pseudohalioglobus lutimaris]